MSKSRTYVFFTWFALFSYVAFRTVGVPGLVLCIESDGGMNVETALNGSCASIQPPARVNSPLASSLTDPNKDEGHCGACLDIPLPEVSPGDDFILVGAANKRLPLASVALLSAWVDHAQPATKSTRLARRTLPPVTSLDALRTVVLLI